MGPESGSRALSQQPTAHGPQPWSTVTCGPRPDSRYATIQVTGCLARTMYRQVPPAHSLVGCCSTRPPGHGPTHGDGHGCSSSQYLSLSLSQLDKACSPVLACICFKGPAYPLLLLLPLPLPAPAPHPHQHQHQHQQCEQTWSSSSSPSSSSPAAWALGARIQSPSNQSTLPCRHVIPTANHH